MRREFGRIILVPFPFTDQTAIKRRPAVVISSDRAQPSRPDLIIMAITSQMHARPNELAIEGWRSAGLAKPSVIKPVVTTIERSLILKELGSLGDEDADRLRRLIAALIG